MIFPADGGSISGIAAAGPVCINDLGKKSVSLAYIDLAAGAQLIPVFNSFVLKPFGQELTTSVPIPPTAADLSSQAATLASDGADCLVIATGQESATLLVKALKQQGYKGRVFISGQVHSQATLLKQVGKEASEGLYVVESYDLTSKLAKQFVKDMNATAGGKAKDLISDQSLKAWLSVKIAGDTLKPLDPKDRATLLGALQQTTYDTQGLLQGPLNYTQRVSNPAVFGGAAPNLILPYAIGAQMKNGKLKPVTDWENAFGGPK
jgi:ABC-type branched-subunit amino acid transport system substrate-binding protein